MGQFINFLRDQLFVLVGDAEQLIQDYIRQNEAIALMRGRLPVSVR
jgi:hypothetical protein